MIDGFLNRALDVYRPSRTGDRMGGTTTTWSLVGSVRCMVCQPSAQERESADQWAAQLTHTVYVPFGADVRRGDELRGGGETFRVLASVHNSRNTYRKLPVERMQPEGA